jgi:hypothetical protein
MDGELESFQTSHAPRRGVQSGQTLQQVPGDGTLRMVKRLADRGLKIGVRNVYHLGFGGCASPRTQDRAHGQTQGFFRHK